MPLERCNLSRRNGTVLVATELLGERLAEDGEITRGIRVSSVGRVDPRRIRTLVRRDNSLSLDVFNSRAQWERSRCIGLSIVRRKFRVASLSGDQIVILLAKLRLCSPPSLRHQRSRRMILTAAKPCDSIVISPFITLGYSIVLVSYLPFAPNKWSVRKE